MNWLTNLSIMLDALKKIEIEDPVDLIIKQIQDLISSGTIKPGEKLPPERTLAEHLGVSRGQIRSAISKLQFYGILKVLPQSGTVVAGIGTVALEGLMTDILKLEKSDFRSLVETRVILEKQAAFYAAERRTEDDLIHMSQALDVYEERIKKDGIAIDEDLLFHTKIIEATKNSVMRSMMIIITPDILHAFNKYKVCGQSDNLRTIREHREIYTCIADKDPTSALKMMEGHLKDVLEFSQTHAEFK